MSAKYKTGDDQLPHFISVSVVEWIDALTRNEYKNIFTESLKYCIKEKEREKRNSSNKDIQFWQQNNHPIELSTPFMLKQKLDYLHENPVRTGIVYEPQDYVYSSAVDYYTKRKGLIAIERLQY